MKGSYILIVLLLLYLFIIGLNLLSNSFEVLSGKGIHNFFHYTENPIASLMVGILITVFLQSSSATTSIIVTMVGANIITVENAIPMIMGSNVGTCITNTIVSYKKDKENFKLAFAGATVHDMYNLLTIGVLFPFEYLSKYIINYPLLYSISKSSTNLLLGNDKVSFKSPIKEIIDPTIKLICYADKEVISELSSGCINCNNSINHCFNLEKTNCITKSLWENEYKNVNLIKYGFLKNVPYPIGGILSLIISILLICISLVILVKILNKIFLRDRRNRFIEIIQKSFSINHYLTILLGLGLTILVQSSSIITSSFTQFVALSIITVEQMYPLTLGANIGTTFTAIFSSLFTQSSNAIQIALCHLYFNLFGIAIWFPVKFMRNIPIKASIKLGHLAYLYNLKFLIFYLVYTFLVFPFIILGFSIMLSINTTSLIFGIILLIIFSISSFMMFKYFEEIIEYVIKLKNKNRYLSMENYNENVIL